jgi:hypothetical protein
LLRFLCRWGRPNYFSGWPRTTIFQILASPVARITAVSTSARPAPFTWGTRDTKSTPVSLHNPRSRINPTSSRAGVWPWSVTVLPAVATVASVMLQPGWGQAEWQGGDRRGTQVILKVIVASPVWLSPSLTSQSSFGALKTQVGDISWVRNEGTWGVLFEGHKAVWQSWNGALHSELHSSARGSTIWLARLHGGVLRSHEK